MRRKLGDAAISAGAVALLLVILVSVDERLRDQVVRVASGGTSSPAVTSVSRDIRRASTTAFTVVSDQSADHAPLVVFAAAATVLMLFMMRT